MRRVLVTLGFFALVASLTGCAALLPSHPARTYPAPPGETETVSLSHTLWRAAQAAGDTPERYSFALVKTSQVVAYAVDDAVFYFSVPLAQLPPEAVDALVAQKVAHEVLGHPAQRRALSLSISTGFTALGVVVPGLGLMDFVANTLIVRAFTREQEFDADRKAVEILGAMGYDTPRRTLADALRVAAARNRPPKHDGLLATEPDLGRRLAALESLKLPDLPPRRAPSLVAP